MRILIAGCGYLGRRVGRLLLSQGHHVFALTRSDRTAGALSALGLDPVLGDVTDAEQLLLPRVDRLVHAVGFDRLAGQSRRQVYVDGLQNVLAAVGRLDRVTYISSTSVYGADDGDWVDESSVAVPASEGGRVCLEAEECLRSADTAAVVVRLAGIYGPNRLLQKVRSLARREAIAGRPDAFLNLTHVDDAAALVARLTVDDDVRPLYLCADGQPPTRQAFYGELCELLQLPQPVFDDTLPTRGGGGLNKRIRSRLLGPDSGWTWQYPTYREGLRQAVRETQFPAG